MPPPAHCFAELPFHINTRVSRALPSHEIERAARSSDPLSVVAAAGSTVLVPYS